MTILILIVMRIFSRMSKERITFHYNKDDALLTEFLNRTSVKELEYSPWILTLTGHLQTFIYVLYEIRMKLKFPLKYER